MARGLIRIYLSETLIGELASDAAGRMTFRYAGGADLSTLSATG